MLPPERQHTNSPRGRVGRRPQFLLAQPHRDASGLAGSDANASDLDASAPAVVPAAADLTDSDLTDSDLTDSDLTDSDLEAMASSVTSTNCGDVT